jgi:uncharacterized protein YrrD
MNPTNKAQTNTVRRVAISLRTYSIVKGQPAYNALTGSVIGKVEDVLFDEQGIVQGLLLNEKGWFKGLRKVSLESVQSIGANGVIVSGDAVIEPLQKHDHQFFCMDHFRTGVLGKPLLTSEGEKLGLVQDVYFQEKMGTIVGIEVTNGWFSDITEGRKVVQTSTPPVIGEEILIVNIPL